MRLSKDEAQFEQEKAKMFNAVKQHLLAHPDASFAEVIEVPGCEQIATVQFYGIRTQLRNTRRIPVPANFKSRKSQAAPKGLANTANSNRVEILYSLDSSDFSPTLVDHYKTTVLPLLQSLLPDGKNIRLVFLSDPATLEIRRQVS